MRCLALLLLIGCSKPPLTIFVINKTGQDMMQFDLDTGSGHIQYQIFSKDYTFKKEISIVAKSPLQLSYVKPSGERVSKTLKFAAEPSQNGGTLRVTFWPDREECRLQMEEIKPKATAEENIADARKMYDQIPVGMSVEEACLILGHDPQGKENYTIGKDFGWSLKPECVELRVVFSNGKVSHVRIFYPYGPRRDEVVVEKP